MGDARYDFGNNWRRFVDDLPDYALEGAREGLQEHVGELDGYSFLDVGSGSGLMSVAALSLGARKVMAIDYDSDAVDTTRLLLERFSAEKDWTVRVGDALADDFGEWQVVYAWGVFHHTGDALTALRRATKWVAPGGRLVVGIYKRTPMCSFWRREKVWYSNAPAWQRRAARWLYMAGLTAAWAAKGESVEQRLGEQRRGMTFSAAVDDWLGGYPYESMTLKEIHEEILPMGFFIEAQFPIPDHMGWFGTGCQTVRYRRSLP